jgi:hypothetical protein
MMMNNQEIIDNAPDLATHIDNEGDYWLMSSGHSVETFMEPDWVFCSPQEPLQSLADIKRIVELETQQARAEILIHELHEQVYDNKYLDNRVRLYEVLKEQYDK